MEPVWAFHVPALYDLAIELYVDISLEKISLVDLLARADDSLRRSIAVLTSSVLISSRTGEHFE